MNDALMNAILSLDAYNRGYNPSLDLRPRDTNGNLILVNGDPIGSDVAGTKLGSAEIITNSSQMEDGNGNSNIDDDISFYALAYSYGTETVIAYRGTDNLDLTDLSSDPYTGWPLGNY